jgi:ubiquinone/menaquinone biosynthesis C-methylase UbiE
MPEDNKYPNLISRGLHEINDAMCDYLKTKIEGRWLDVGANIGTLLAEVPNGVGIDLSLEAVKKAGEAGHNVIHADAKDLPFEDDTFDTVVLSCVLEQIPMWQDALDEAIRVCKGKVIGLNPIPKESIWGEVGGTEWVKSVIPEEDMRVYGAKILYPTELKGKYFFEITKK